jgi:iron(III) transport system ATP-binding protein
VPVLRDIGLEVQRGELLVLLGPSGCGKTTLLRCIVGLERPDMGIVELGGQRVVDGSRNFFMQPNRRDVAMVFQNYALWPHMKVSQNVAYPLKARRMKKDLSEGRVNEVLDIVQCGHLADRYPPELSGGQQQRVSLARALASRPALLLMDEPLSNLDAQLRLEVRAQLRLLHRQLGFTAIYVTHDQEEGLALGTRVAVMRDGQFEQVGPPEEVYRQPATEYVADFLGARNRLEATVDVEGSAAVAGSRLSRFMHAGVAGSYTLRLRDRDIQVREPGLTAWPSRTHLLEGARVLEVLPLGHHYEYVLELDGARLFASVPLEQGAMAPGQTVELGLDPERIFCYAPDGTLVSDWAPPA